MNIIIKEYGASIRKEGNFFVLSKKDDTKKILADDIDTIELYPACSISSDAIELCAKKDIFLTTCDKYGNPIGTFNPFLGGCSPIYKRKQLLLVNSTYGIDISKSLLRAKLLNRIQHLNDLRSDFPSQNSNIVASINSIYTATEKLMSLHSTAIKYIRPQLQAYEGNAGNAYFSCISLLLPPEYAFSSRHTRGARDIYNTVLNYSYGMLYPIIKEACLKARLDPYIGIMHVDKYNTPTFTFDIIERYRIICERITFELCTNNEISKHNFSLENNRLIIDSEGKKTITTAFLKTMKSPYPYIMQNCIWNSNTSRRSSKPLRSTIFKDIQQLAAYIGNCNISMS